MLVIRDLMKTYSSGVQALKGISLQIQPGMFGLLGPNGAGKTTLMKILATLLEPDSGTAELDRLNLIAAKAETRKKLGYLPQDFGLYPTLTAAQMLDYFAKLKGVTDKKVELGKATVNYDTKKTSKETIVAAIEKAGFKVK